MTKILILVTSLAYQRIDESGGRLRMRVNH
jgi:hypothetical protein